MSDLIEVGETGDINDGAMKEVVVGDRAILLARVGGSYYAADNRCPHMGGRLSRGKLEGTVVTCPRHGSQFDLRNGEVVRWLKGGGVLSGIGRMMKSQRPLGTYNVRVEDDRIVVEM